MEQRGQRPGHHAGISDQEFTRRENQRLLDTRAAADYLGLKPATLEIWRTNGRYDLPYFKVGRWVRYRQGDLDSWLAGRLVRHTGEAL